jgi:RNA polymerase primary sigma factor
MKKRKFGTALNNEQMSSMQKYMNKISTGTINTKDEEKYSTKDELVRNNLRIVVMIAHQWKSSLISLDDLIQEGNIGIMKAAEKFDPNRGTKFITYARHYIVKYMRKAVHKNFPVTSGYGKTFVVSMDAPVFENDHDENCINSSKIGCDKIPSPDADMMNRDDMEFIMGAINKYLTEKEIELVMLRYGFNGGKPMILRELAKIYGCSYEMINIRLRRVNEKLRCSFLENHLNLAM